MKDTENLRQGNCYFLMSFFDRDLKIPHIKTYIYVGKNLYSDRDVSKGDEWFFQDPESYLKHGAFDKFMKEMEYDLLIADRDIIPHMYDLSALISTLEKVNAGVLSKTGI